MVTLFVMINNSTARNLAVSVTTAPRLPATITGNNMVNVGQTLTYSISPISGATGYTWSASGGGTIVLKVFVATAIIDSANGYKIKLFPNPIAGDLYLKAQGMNYKKIRIEVFNLL
jgi:hypothetical protein